MRKAIFILGAALLGIAGCDEPQPERVLPASMTAPGPANGESNPEPGGRSGVDVNVDVQPTPGGPSVNVDVDRPAEPASRYPE